MKITGLIDYDPVHRVPPKKEYAIKRTAAMTAIGLVTQCIPYAKGKTLKHCKRQLELFSSDPHCWIRKGKERTSIKDVDRLYSLLEELRYDTAVNEFLSGINSRLCRTETKPWTAIVRVDRKVIKPHLLALAEQKITISPSAWGPHITWVKAECPRNTENWGLYQDLPITLELDPELRTNGTYYWLDIKSPELSAFRTQLGLRPFPRVPLHLTIGKVIT